jgi:hypothetical protein
MNCIKKELIIQRKKRKNDCKAYKQVINLISQEKQNIKNEKKNKGKKFEKSYQKNEKNVEEKSQQKNVK